jgi:hypothetical protein
MKTTINSHLVSQVILKQFANKDSDGKWQTLAHDKSSGIAMLRKIDSVASREIERSVIEALEQQWSNDIEKEADKAINSIANNNWADKHIGIIKDLMALHFIRSQAFELVGNNIGYINKTLEAKKNEVVAIYPGYIDAINRVYEDSVKTAPLDIVLGILKTYIAQTKEFLSDAAIGLEVGKAPDGVEFIVGDVPVITLNRASEVVPVTEANYVGMPITPKYLVALKKNPDKKKPVMLTEKQVKNANNKQVELALTNYFSVPK